MASDKQWIRGTLPRRGSARKLPPTPYGARLTERVQRGQRKQAIGRPLAVAIGGQAAATRGMRQAPSIPGLVAMAAGLAGSVLAAVQGSLLLAALATAALAAGLCLCLRAAGAGRHGKVGDIARDVAELDALLNRVSPALPQDALRSLAAMKETLARVIEILTNEQRARAVPAEEQFFVREVVSRYLPDLCRHYLSVRLAAQGLDVRHGERTPEELLLSQLDVLHGRLRRVLALAAADEVEKLALHEAFIKAKK